ncbi:Flp pilus assembly protein CpaB [Caulobacter sp. NIBR2454]|uniref:Flp pilus assembly protein CpaB n=1 Tax=Caulobacter sp. NIBR2454 TaxID=3015996 RepID=UPI0022B6E0E1|nr:Flp pilus assembly protein CpaB [Caulobacter sp. NIBR2454]
MKALRRLGQARLLIIGGGVLGLCLIAAGVVRVIHDAGRSEAVTSATAKPRAVVVQLKVPKGRGEAIKAEDVQLLSLADPAAPGLANQTQAVVGKVALEPLAAGQLIADASVTAEPGKAGLSAVVPSGLRAVTLSADVETAVGYLLQPGDRVDVTFVSRDGVGAASASLLLQDLVVAAVDGRLDSQTKDAAASTASERPITLLANPQQAERLFLARGQGKVFLSLRHPLDRSPATQAAPAVTTPTPLRTQPRVARPPAPRGAPVEIVVAGRSQVIYPGRGEAR